MTEQRVSRRFFSALFWLIATAVVTLALMPSSPSLGLSDKAEHALAFACLSAVSLMAFPQQRPLVLALALACLGGFIELLQSWPASHRSPDSLDWLADCTAITLVFGSAMVFKRIAAARA